VCGNRERHIEYELKAGNVVACTGCSLVSMVGVDTTELVRCCYDENYYRRGDSPCVAGYFDYFGAEAKDRRATAETLALAIRSLAPRARRVLDLGCGGGYLVSALHEQGIEAVGADTSAYAIGRAVAAESGRFVHGGADGAEISALAPYDSIAMIDVIEHLPDPVTTLRQVTALMRPGGLILVLTPRYGGRLQAEQGSEYVHFARDHMYYFTAQTLRAVLARGTKSARIQIDDVLHMLDGLRIEVPRAMERKYSMDRESMIACVHA